MAGNQAVYPSEWVADAFGRSRVSEPVTLFDSKLLIDKRPLDWDEKITDTSGNAASTFVAADSLVTMYVEAQDTIIRQTRAHFHYSPGKSQQIIMTGILTEGGTGVTGRLGYFDAQDGMFFQVSGTTHSVVVRKATSDTVVAQSAWNLDPMDGTGPSGFALDFSKIQVFTIDFEWLSAGRIRFGFYIDGRAYYCHEITNLNALTAPYVSTPNLPVRYEIASAAGGASVTMKHVCSTVMSEGATPDLGRHFIQTTGNTAIAAGTADTIYALAGIRMSTAAADHGVAVRPEHVTVFNEAATDYEWRVYVNPTIAASSAWTYAAVKNSQVQWAVAGSTANKIAAGSTAYEWLVDAGYVKSGNQSGIVRVLSGNQLYTLGRRLNSTRDEFVLAARPLGNNASFQASIAWKEIE